MNPAEWKHLHTYYAYTSTLKQQIEQVERFIDGIKSRSKLQEQRGNLRVSVYRQDQYARDGGCWVQIPEAICRTAIVPALQTALEELRTSYRAIPFPPTSTKESPHA